ncbi:hypothetical protein SKAU_G00230210, partial [Synaphobranchus kaupii]
IDKDINQKYSLSSSTELNTIRSVTLGKVKGTDILDEEVLQAGSRGFIGCLSSVQFNQVAPLKAALLNRGSSLVSLRGHIVESNCGASADMTKSHSLSDHSEKVDRGKEPLKDGVQSDSAVIGGVSAAVVFITLCVVAVMTRFLYQYRRAEQTAAIEEKDHRHSLEVSYRTELDHQSHRHGLNAAYCTEMDLQKSVRNSRKEYYI